MNNQRAPRHPDPPEVADRSEALVARLIRLAEHADETLPVPRDGMAQARAAIHPLWRSKARNWTRRRWLRRTGIGLAAAATAVLAVGLMLRAREHSPAPVIRAATLVRIDGSLELIQPVGGASRLDTSEIGRAIRSGARLQTGPESRAALRLAGGQSLRIDHNTRLRIASARVVELDRGALYIDSESAPRAGSPDPGAAAAGVEVRTFLGVARDIGTQFEVRRDAGSLTIRVREGAVALLRPSEELEIRHGTELEVRGDGTRQTGALASDAPAWRWVQTVAPPFDVEGRSVVTFLDWISRETGLWVSFADPEVERFAAETTLHGTIEGLEPARALDVVLAGCGLNASRQDGRLLVARADGSPSP